MFYEEDLEQQIRLLNANPRSSELLDVATAKRVLRNGLAGFEKLLRKLRPAEHQAALRLYLDRIKYVTFRFNLTVLKMNIKASHRSFSSRQEMQAAVKQAKKDFDELAHLYEML
jgi:hypothetical protein